MVWGSEMSGLVWSTICVDASLTFSQTHFLPLPPPKHTHTQTHTHSHTLTHFKSYVLYLICCITAVYLHSPSSVKAESIFWSIGEKSRRGRARKFKVQQHHSVAQSACFNVIVIDQWKGGLQCKPETLKWIRCVFTVSERILATLTTYTKLS